MGAVLAERESKGKRHMPGDETGAQIAELQADVRHLQSDMTDVKSELRAVRQKFDDLEDSLFSAKLWAIGLYVTQSGTMLLVMAHGFKWI